MEGRTVDNIPSFRLSWKLLTHKIFVGKLRKKSPHRPGAQFHYARKARRARKARKDISLETQLLFSPFPLFLNFSLISTAYRAKRPEPACSEPVEGSKGLPFTAY
jgi:hypothetical protein